MCPQLQEGDTMLLYRWIRCQNLNDSNEASVILLAYSVIYSLYGVYMGRSWYMQYIWCIRSKHRLLGRYETVGLWYVQYSSQVEKLQKFLQIVVLLFHSGEIGGTRRSINVKTLLNNRIWKKKYKMVAQRIKNTHFSVLNSHSCCHMWLNCYLYFKI